MILDALLTEISQQNGVTRAELAKLFALSEDGIDAMLAVWIKRGKISRMVDTNRNQEVVRVRYYQVISGSISLSATL
ncbi:iron transporter FeoC [Vibrio sp. SM6]|uniref:Iron transporter FeoC n=1 Tax=Vibrio agarilyticus TaxID=2726741 RepID=A0A7X8TMN9_9VIBR|nr:FeoC-like transcriptional regulator [Vibrio agarilyticus]NLS11568.1 iron transporter FeoC [Vibrio agarilyticus]